MTLRKIEKIEVHVDHQDSAELYNIAFHHGVDKGEGKANQSINLDHEREKFRQQLQVLVQEGVNKALEIIS